MNKIMLLLFIYFSSLTLLCSTNYVENEILVRFKNDTCLNQFLIDYSIFGLDTLDCVTNDKCLWSFEFDSTLISVDSLQSIIILDTCVTRAFFNYKQQVQSCVTCETTAAYFDDDLYCSQYYLHSYGQKVDGAGSTDCSEIDNDINAPCAWEKLGIQDTNYLGDKVVIAVIDVDFSINNSDINFTDGWNFITYDNAVNRPPPTGSSNHGTSVAGIIGAKANGEGLVGVLPGISILPLHVSNDPTNVNGIKILEAINYVIEQRKLYDESLKKSQREGKFIVAVNTSISGSLDITGTGTVSNELQMYIDEYQNQIERLSEYGILYSSIASNTSKGPDLNDRHATVENEVDVPAYIETPYQIITSQLDANISELCCDPKILVSSKSIDLTTPAAGMPHYYSASTSSYYVNSGNSWAAPQTTAVYASFFIKGGSNFYNRFHSNPQETQLELIDLILTNGKDRSSLLNGEVRKINGKERSLDFCASISAFDDIYDVSTCYDDQSTTKLYSKLYNFNNTNTGELENIDDNINLFIGFPQYLSTNSNVKVDFDGNDDLDLFYFADNILDIGSGYSAGQTDVKETRVEDVLTDDGINLSVSYLSCTEVKVRNCTSFLTGSDITIGIRKNPDNEVSTSDIMTHADCNTNWKKVNKANESSISYVGLSPNPVTSTFTFSYIVDKNNSDVNFEIISLNGNVVISRLLKGNVGTNSEIVDMSLFPTGTYLLNFKEGEKLIYTDKIVLVK